MGWGQPAAYNGVVSYVYAARNTGNGDPGDVFYPLHRPGSHFQRAFPVEHRHRSHQGPMDAEPFGQ